jgi:hypothetical protein
MFQMSFSIKRIALTLAAAAVATVALAAVGPAPAEASGITVRLAPASNPFLFVEVSGASLQPGAPIIQWPFNNGLNQVWRLSPAGTDFNIINRWSGQCITTDAIAGHWVYQSVCNGSAAQQWATSITPGNLVGYAIRNPASALYLEIQGASASQGAHLDVWYPNGGHNQYFVASNT